jgi:DNA polymerase-3 subunit alpha
LFDLMGAGDASGGDPILRKSQPMPRLERLRNEKELLGMYLSGHPLADFHGLDEAIATFKGSLADVTLPKDGRHMVRICGIIGGLEKKLSKKDNRPWAVFTIADRRRSVPVLMFTEADEKAAALREGDAPLLMDGAMVAMDCRLVHREERGEWALQAHSLRPLRDCASLIARATFVLRPGPEAEAFLARLSEVARRIDGPTAVSVAFLQPDGRQLVADAARGMTTLFDPAIYAELGKHPACVGVQIEPVPPSSPPQRRYSARD